MSDSGVPATTVPPETTAPPDTTSAPTTAATTTSTTAGAVHEAPSERRRGWPLEGISDSGITLPVPDGWEGIIYRHPETEVAFDDPERGAVVAIERGHSIGHLATFPIPEARGDYGSGAVERMGDRDIFVVVFEFDPASASAAMFSAEGVPGPLEADDFDPNQLQRPEAPRAGVQRFFNVAGRRAFCLHVVIGNHAERHVLIDEVNEVLAAIVIDA